MDKSTEIAVIAENINELDPLLLGAFRKAQGLSPKRRRVALALGQGLKSKRDIATMEGISPSSIDRWLDTDEVFHDVVYTLHQHVANQFETPVAQKRAWLHSVVAQGLAMGSPAALREVTRAVETLERIDNPQDGIGYGYGHGGGGSLKASRHFNRAMNGQGAGIVINIGALRDDSPPIEAERD